MEIKLINTMKTILTFLFTVLSFLSVFAQEENEVITKSTSKPFEDASIELGVYSGFLNYQIEKVSQTINSGTSTVYFNVSPSIGIKAMYQFEFDDNQYLNFGVTASTFSAYRIFYLFNYNTSSNLAFVTPNKQIFENRLWGQYAGTSGKWGYYIGLSPFCVTNFYTALNYDASSVPSTSKIIIRHSLSSLLVATGLKYAVKPNLIATAEIQYSANLRFHQIVQLGFNYSIKDIIQ
ncbi:MAG: hypothetical protein RJA07_1723 [Bacteroidota bacterium]|jgi:hypothetical protein